jgi:hypothetical protein
MDQRGQIVRGDPHQPPDADAGERAGFHQPPHGPGGNLQRRGGLAEGEKGGVGRH